MGNFFYSEPESTKLIDRAQIIPASGEHKATIIWMHGLGDSSKSFTEVFSREASHPNIRVVLPNAPIIPITINGGMQMPAWYDIRTIDQTKYLLMEDQKGIKRSGNLLLELLESECQKVSSSKIFIGGFSQGGAMAIQAGLTFKKKLAGIAACSGYVVLTSEYPENISSANKNTPVFAWHGQSDPTVPLMLAKLSYGVLQKSGISVQFQDEPRLGHGMSVNTWKALIKWWIKQLGISDQ